MIRIRPYKSTDADKILLWCQDERAFYQWSAGVMGEKWNCKELKIEKQVVTNS